MNLRKFLHDVKYKEQRQNDEEEYHHRHEQRYLVFARFGIVGWLGRLHVLRWKVLSLERDGHQPEKQGRRTSMSFQGCPHLPQGIESPSPRLREIHRVKRFGPRSRR